MGTQTYLPPNPFSPRISAILFWMLLLNIFFIIKCWITQNIYMCQEKKLLKYNFWEGGRPRWFLDCGGRVPPPPAFCTDAYGKHFKQSIA